MISKFRSIYNRYFKSHEQLTLITLAIGVSVLFQQLVPSSGTILDEIDYVTLAENLVDSGNFGTSWGRAWHSPGYPLFISLFFWMFGKSLPAVKLGQSILGGLAVLVVYQLGRRLWNEGVGMRAALITAMYPYLILYHQILFSETLFMFIFAVSLLCLTYALTSQKWRYFFLTGIAIASAIYTRPLWMLFPFFLFGLLVHPTFRTKRVVAGLTLLTLTACIALVPWHIRNHYAIGSGWQFSTKGGLNFRIGANPYANGTQISHTTLDYPMDENELKRARRLPEAEQSRMLLGNGIEYVLKNPIAWLALGVNKVSYLWNIETRDFLYLYGQGRWQKSSILFLLGILATSLPFLLLALASLRGIVSIGFTRPITYPLLISLIYITLIAFVFFGDNRHHLPGVPILAFYGCAWLYGERRRLDKQKTAVFAVLVGLFIMSTAYRIHIDIRTFRSMSETPQRFSSAPPSSSIESPNRFPVIRTKHARI